MAAYSAVSTSLALRSDRRLGELVDGAVPLGSGIGGRSALLEVDGKPVFVKRVPLTDLERLPEHDPYPLQALRRALHADRSRRS